MEHFLLILFAVCGGILLIFAIKKCRLRHLLLSAGSGLAALIAADLIGGFFDYNLPLNVFSVSLSALGGLPGVILLNLLSVLFR